MRDLKSVVHPIVKLHILYPGLLQIAEKPYKKFSNSVRFYYGSQTSYAF